ncbi:MAG: N-acetylmuramate alpha-1-phosphate uridylyltransferase MurU [Pseudomonadota bacterium]
MKAMILAAGRGARLSPLTDTTPKPLLMVRGKTLLDWQLDKLIAAGFSEIVINVGYLGEKIKEHLSRHWRNGIDIQFSLEPETALETGGGIQHALALLGEGAFAVVNADVWTNFDFSRLRAISQIGPDNWRGHLVLVDNPAHNLSGDFGLDNGWVSASAEQSLTFSGVSVLHSKLFAGLAPGRFPLAPILQKSASQNSLTGERFDGLWIDIGTEKKLIEINNIDI